MAAFGFHASHEPMAAFIVRSIPHRFPLARSQTNNKKSLTADPSMLNAVCYLFCQRFMIKINNFKSDFDFVALEETFIPV